MSFYADVARCPSQCGGRTIHSFLNYSDGDNDPLEYIKEIQKGKMLIATFNEYQRDAYEACCKEFTWLGQSKPIRNNSSGNYIFTAVFKA